MDKLTTAEWLLARITSKARAEEIVGDLAERRLPAFAFWSAFTRIVLAFTWRWFVAVPAAMLSVFIAMKPYSKLVVLPYVDEMNRHRTHFYGGAVSMPLPMQIGMYLVLTGACLWTVAALAFIRYGHRSGIMRVSCTLATLFTVGACLVRAPYAVIAAPVALFCAVGVLLFYPPWRRLFLCVLAASIAFVTGVMGVAAAANSCRVTYPDHFSALVAFFLVAGYFACIVGEAFVLDHMRRWLRVA